jgi:hypothetical protein
MASNNTTKNLTMTLPIEVYEDLEGLVDYFQQQSISSVTKTDVIKFMIKQMKRTVEQDLVNEYNTMLNKAEKENVTNSNEQ